MLHSDIIDHRDINILSFHNYQDIINVYSDSNQIAIQALCDCIRDIRNMIVMTGDFNIRDSDWDPNFYYYSVHSEDLLSVSDSLGLELSHPINPGPTRFVDNWHETNSVLDLVFMVPNNPGFGRYTLYPEICKPSDYVPLIITVGIKEENIDIVLQSIKKDSNEEKKFINSIKKNIKSLNIATIANKEDLQICINQLADIFSEAWAKHSKLKYITKYSKEWWNQECTDNIHRYHKQGDL